MKNSMLEALDARLDKDPSNEELWIVEEFLNRHKVSFVKGNLKKEAIDSKTDIIFKDICFQIKKIVYPCGYKPKAEDKNLKEKVILSNSIEEYTNAIIEGPFDNEGFYPSDFLKNLIVSKVNYWTEKKDKGGLKYSPEIRAQLDLLFYVQNDLKKKKPTGFAFHQDISSSLKDFGWRSISYLFGSQSLVLYISDNTSEILRKIYLQQCEKT